MEIKKETMLDDTGAANKKRKPKHWQTPHYPKNTPSTDYFVGKRKPEEAFPSEFFCGLLDSEALIPLAGGVEQNCVEGTSRAESLGQPLLKEGASVENLTTAPTPPSLQFRGISSSCRMKTRSHKGLRVCQLGSDGNRSLAQHTFIALLLHAKKCTKIWNCVTQQRKRLISRKPPCLGREIEYQHKVVKSCEGDECHKSMEEGF
nr:uncharacterized protein LOC129058388 [Pongo abelii]